MDCGRDRHFDGELFREFLDGFYGISPFGHLAKRGRGLVQRHPAADHLAKAKVARVAAVGCDHQIAYAGEAGKSLGTAAQRDSQTGDFRKAARDHRRRGVVAHLQTVEKSRGDGDDVFHGAADFHSGHVRVRINAECLSVEEFLPERRGFPVQRRGNERHRQVADHFFRVAWP